jgi:hypothetical protein
MTTQDVGTHLRQLNSRGPQRVRLGNRKAFRFDEFRQPFKLFRIIVDQQDVWHEASFFFGTALEPRPGGSITFKQLSSTQESTKGLQIG